MTSSVVKPDDLCDGLAVEQHQQSGDTVGGAARVDVQQVPRELPAGVFVE